MKRAIIPFIYFTLAFLVLLHQYIFFGYWWYMDDLFGLHHESLALCFFIVGLVYPTLRRRFS